MTITALKITADHEIEVVQIDGLLADFYRLIGCDTIQGIYGFDWGGPNWGAFIDEDGKITDPPKEQNVTAEVLARACGWLSEDGDYLVGTVVFVGPVDEDGNETSVPQHLVDRAPHARARAIALLNRAAN